MEEPTITVEGSETRTYKTDTMLTIWDFGEPGEPGDRIKPKCELFSKEVRAIQVSETIYIRTNFDFLRSAPRPPHHQVLEFINWGYRTMGYHIKN